MDQRQGLQLEQGATTPRASGHPSCDDRRLTTIRVHTRTSSASKHARPQFVVQMRDLSKLPKEVIIDHKLKADWPVWP